MPPGAPPGATIQCNVPAEPSRSQIQPAKGFSSKVYRIKVPPGTRPGHTVMFQVGSNKLSHATVEVPASANSGDILSVRVPDIFGGAKTTTRIRIVVPPGAQPGKQLVVQVQFEANLWLSTI